MNSVCEYGYGICTAPDTICPHWQGTFCELDELNHALSEYENWCKMSGNEEA